jgi:hypothetical protein
VRQLIDRGEIEEPAAYFERICPGGINEISLRRLLAQSGITILRDRKLPDLSDICEQIREYRLERGTFRGDWQVAAEAEVLHVIRSLRSGTFPLNDGVLGSEENRPNFDRVYFISTSRVLDRVFIGDGIVTWSPEALYRYVLAIPGETPVAELVHESMFQEFFEAGAIFVDRNRHMRMFGPSIDEARLSFRDQQERFLAESGRSDMEQFEDAFERTPDLQKPFFTTQMGLQLARSAEERARAASAQAAVLQARVNQLEAEKEVAWRKKRKVRAEQLAAEHRNAANPRHVRKRLKQAKRRNRRSKSR